MGRGIIVDEKLSEYITSLLSGTERVTGLIIGQSTSSKDYVVHLAPTPPPSETMQCEHTEEEDVKTTGKGFERRKSKEKKLAKAASFSEDIDDIWIAQHGKQVTRMLPGGWDILGIFICSSDDSLPTATLSKLRQVLNAIYKLLEKHPRVYSGVDMTDRILLHVSTVTKKITCKILDLTNSVSSPRPSEWKYQPGSKWIRLECRLALDVAAELKSGQGRQPLMQQIRSGLSDFCDAFDSSTLLFNKQVRDEDEMLSGSTASDRSGKNRHHKRRINAGDEDAEQQSYTVDILMKPTSPVSASQVIVESSEVSMHMKGVVQGKTYVHTKATVKEAVLAIRQDLLRSLFSRCEIHCEDLLLIDEEQQDPWVVHEPPRRVFAPFPNNQLTVSDYLFPGESAADALSALDELLDLRVSEAEVETKHERSAESSDLQCPVSFTTHKEMMSGTDILPTVSNKEGISWNVVGIGLSAAVAVIGAGMSYMFLQDGH